MAVMEKLSEGISWLSGLTRLPASLLGVQPHCAADKEPAASIRKHTRRGHSYALSGMVLLSLVYGSQAWGQFDFSGSNARKVTVSESNDLIPYSFSVTFQPSQQVKGGDDDDDDDGGSCSGDDDDDDDDDDDGGFIECFANYRLALADGRLYKPSSFIVTELEKAMQLGPSVMVYPSQGTPASAPISSAGGWTHGNSKNEGFKPGNALAKYITAEFKVKLKPQRLRELAIAGEDLKFYVHGEETSKTTRSRYFDNQPVTVSINYPAKYKVSGLRDLAIYNSENIGGYYQNQMEFCIYVSRDPRDYKINIYGKDWDNFMLTGGSGSFNYEVLFADSIAGLNTATPEKKPFERYLNNGSTTENCDNYTQNNGAIRIRVPAADVPGSGVYKDTVTVEIGAT